MDKIEGYCDLCLSGIKNIKELKLMIAELVELEYKNVALEQIYDDTKTSSKDKKTDPIPEPMDISFLKEFEGKIRIFRRLSIIFNDNSVALVTNKSKHLKQYDLVAAIPTTDSAFTYACQNLNCDLISYNSDTIRLRFTRTHYLQAVSRKIYFEIKYAPSIVDSSERKSTISKSHKYRDLGKARNIILSSGATDKFQLRSPYDVANLGWIFGLSEEQSKESIRGKPRLALIKGEIRKQGGMLTFVKKLADLGVYNSDEYSEDEEMPENPSKKQKIM